MDYEFHWNVVIQKLPEMLQAAFVTLHVSVLSMFIGIIFAIFLAIFKMNQTLCCVLLSPRCQASSPLGAPQRENARIIFAASFLGSPGRLRSYLGTAALALAHAGRLVRPAQVLAFPNTP